MNTTRTATSGLQVRSDVPVTLVRDDDEGSVIVGRAVPYDDEVELWPGLFESFAPGAVAESDGKLCWRHGELIGTYTGENKPDGFHYRGTVSDTALGRDALTLVRDGAADHASVGFMPLEWDETRDELGLHIRHTKVRVREISPVPHPAYANTSAETREETPMTTTPTPPPSGATLDGLALELADVRRLLSTVDVREHAPTVDRRSAGALLRAAATTREDAAIEALNRAYVGGTSADDYGTPTWVGDLVNLVEQADELDMFATAPLPETGMTLEFGRLASNNVTVAKQANEGDTIPKGNLTVETDSVPVETWAGGASLTIQEIKRAQAPLLDMHLRAMALEAGKARAAAKLAKLNAVIAANVTAGKLVNLTAGDTWQAWVDPMVDAVQRFKPLGLALNGLMLPETDWVAMAKWTDADGRPMLTPANTARDAGTFAIKTLDGELLTIPTRMVTGLTQAAFFNVNAIRTYTSPLVKLTDTDVFTLSEDVAVYTFGAVADEIPDAIVPVGAAV